MYRLKALSSFPKSIFLGRDELRGRRAEEEGTGSATSASSSSTNWEIGWYSERLSIVEEVKWSRSWGRAEDAARSFRHDVDGIAQIGIQALRSANCQNHT